MADQPAKSPPKPDRPAAPPATSSSSTASKDPNRRRSSRDPRAEASSDKRKERMKERPLKGPSSKTRAATTACIWDDFRSKGEVLIGDQTIIGPGCTCISHGGPIIIGSQNVLTECVQIVNKSPDQKMVIGDLNMFETGAKIEAKRIGSYNLFGAKSYVMQNCKISNGCVVGPRVQVITGKTITDSTIIAGENLIQSQTAFKHRNSVYLQRMVQVLSAKFQKKKAENDLKKKREQAKRAARPTDSSRRSSRQGQRSTLSSRTGSRTTSQANVPSSSRVRATTAKAADK